jgi:hypothetical protein
MSQIKDGYLERHLSSYRCFYDEITRLVVDTRAPYTSLIFRGHRREDWKLEPTLDRELRKLGVGELKDPQIRRKHLRSFKYAMRGRRDPNLRKNVILLENDWWSLGQHHGLSTPLLDWTTSPFVAMYFAYFEENPQDEKPSSTDRRCVFALSGTSVEILNAELRKRAADPKVRKTLEFYRPLTDENARLVSQAGLFTRSPDGMCVEEWVKTNYAGVTQSWHLLKITFPDSEREEALRTLNLMNINHLTLFPDAYGASKFCNFGLQIQHY